MFSEESIIDYNKGISFKNAISKAGGYLNNADKRAYVEYQNGQNKSINNFLIFKFYPKLKSGSKIKMLLLKMKTDLRLVLEKLWDTLQV